MNGAIEKIILVLIVPILSKAEINKEIDNPNDINPIKKIKNNCISVIMIFTLKTIAKNKEKEPPNIPLIEVI